MEALSVEQRLERLERLHGIAGPAICPDPTGEWSAWQGSPTPAEPAPGSDAEHPPEGYRLEPVGGKRAPGYVWWCPTTYKWQPAQMDMMGKTVYPTVVVANPIPANEGDSQKTKLSDEIAESVVQDLQQACYDRDELRATVERLTAELDTTKRLLAESLVERDRLKNLHDARKVRIDGFRDVLREKLGDLV